MKINEATVSLLITNKVLCLKMATKMICFANECGHCAAGGDYDVMRPLECSVGNNET